MLVGALAGAALLATVAVAVAMALGGDGDDGGGGGNPAARGPCTEKTLPAQGRNHVPPGKLPKGFEYNSFPPVTGHHHPNPAVFAVYDEPVPQKHLLHNLEHGAIVIQYGKDISPETVNRIVAWYREDPSGLVVAPLPDRPEAQKLRDKITLAAWVAEIENRRTPQQRIVSQNGILATCSRFDEQAFSEFRDDYRARGPEPFNADELRPGAP